MKRAILIFVLFAGFALTVVLMSPQGGRAQGPESEESQIQQGFAIAPVHLNLRGKNRALVGLGSYLVNTGGCNDCHTEPSYVPGHDPFLGQPEMINRDRYLAGGMAFGPFISRNLTPNAGGLPAGLTFEQFLHVLRTGEDLDHLAPHVPSDENDLLQVMPWPVFGKKTDRDIRAIYEYLRSIPSLAGYPE
jgi:hypothetical protein